MNTVKRFEIVQKLWPGFQFYYLKLIKEIRLWQVGNQINLELKISSVDCQQDFLARIRFEGVSCLNFRDFDGPEIEIKGFEILDISNDQWEGKKWKVSDFENNAISFYADSAEIVDFEKSK